MYCTANQGLGFGIVGRRTRVFLQRGRTAPCKGSRSIPQGFVGAVLRACNLNRLTALSNIKITPGAQPLQGRTHTGAPLHPITTGATLTGCFATCSPGGDMCPVGGTEVAAWLKPSPLKRTHPDGVGAADLFFVSRGFQSPAALSGSRSTLHSRRSAEAALSTERRNGEGRAAPCKDLQGRTGLAPKK